MEAGSCCAFPARNRCCAYIPKQARKQNQRKLQKMRTSGLTTLPQNEGNRKTMNARDKNPSFFRRNLRTILGVAILALTIHDVFGPHGFLAMRRTQQEIKQFSAEMQKLDQENRSEEHTSELQSLRH